MEKNKLIVFGSMAIGLLYVVLEMVKYKGNVPLTSVQMWAGFALMVGAAGYQGYLTYGKRKKPVSQASGPLPAFGVESYRRALNIVAQLDTENVDYITGMLCLECNLTVAQAQEYLQIFALTEHITVNKKGVVKSNVQLPPVPEPQEGKKEAKGNTPPVSVF